MQIGNTATHVVDRRGRTSNEIAHSVGHQFDTGRLSTWAPLVTRNHPRFRLKIENYLSDVDCRYPIDHRVVCLGEDRKTTSFETLNEVHLPQRPRTIQRPRHDASHEVTQLSFRSRFGQRRAPHMVGNVEALIVNPDRVGEAARNPTNSLAEPRNERNPALDQPNESVVVEALVRRLEDRHTAHVHGGGRLL